MGCLNNWFRDGLALCGGGPASRIPPPFAGKMADNGPTDAQKTPVTIVTGFLGAGKTTLVNYILNGNHGKTIAVIENEFGEVNIDEALVSENLQFKEDVISMDNGCVPTPALGGPGVQHAHTA